MVSPYFIDPGTDLTQGLAGLREGIAFGQRQDLLEKKENKEIAELERKKQISKIALEAYKTGDPDKIAEIALAYPEIAPVIGQLYERKKDYNQEQYADQLENALTTIVTGKSTTPEEDKTLVPTGGVAGPTGIMTGPLPLPGINPSIPGQPAGKIDIINSILKKQPKIGRRLLESELAQIAPKRYEAWKEIHDPEVKKASTSSLGKMIAERQALLDQGLKEDDPAVQAYTNKIWPEKDPAKQPAPSNIQKMMNERDALAEQIIADGGDPSEHPDIKAFNRKILGEEKSYGPSPLKKLVLEREERAQQLADKGVSEEQMAEDPIIRAYDMRIAGIDIDIEEMDQNEIDFWGKWVNLSGKMPSVGRGKQATKIRAAIIKSAARQAYEDYGNKHPGDEKITPADAALEVVATSADTKSIQSSLTFLDKQYSAMGSFIQNMDEQITHLDELSKDLETFDTRLLNIPLRFVRGKILGSPLQAKYDLYLIEIESEIGKLAQGNPQSIAELSTSAQEKWDKIHDKNLSVKDMLSLLEETRVAADMRLRSVKDQLDRTRTRMRTREYPGEEATGMPTINTIEEYEKLNSGDWYIDQQTGIPAQKP